ncbi:MAG: DUF1326 domain-containing protein [Acidobacteriota bacterium]|nr:DUF1326 domain-containing protein [Blastocatellia bacterium]MDW8240255.1 DUF1326 domain-containing protein [Acidobacteriota bacterium]
MMMSRFSFMLGIGVMLLTLSTVAQAQQIRGDYVETRSADVYTGACVANGEVGLVGDQAILAWRVQQGEWKGVRLDGLSVVGVVKAKATLGDPHSSPYPAKAVLIVDERASAEQRTALVGLAQELAGDLLKNVVHTEVAPIRLEMRHDDGHHAHVSLRAGHLAAIETRTIAHTDHLCGNEETYYPPLVALCHAMPAVATLDQYTGPALGVSWTLQGKRSAFVGSFSR